MAGKATRNKGRKGEREAKALLLDRDYAILADTTAGLETDDLVVQGPDGTVYSVEVKNTKQIDIPSFRTQAIKNAKKTPWMLLCRIDREGCWLVLRRGKFPVVWHDKGGADDQR